MLFLVAPSYSMSWIGMPADVLMNAARNDGADLSKLEWEPSETRADETTVRLALRSGVPASGGVVISAADVSLQQHPENIRQAHANAEASRAKLAGQEVLMETIAPGWVERGKKMSEGVETSVQGAIREAESVLADALAAEPDAALVEHWQSIGGQLPDPL